MNKTKFTIFTDHIDNVPSHMVKRIAVSMAITDLRRARHRAFAAYDDFNIKNDQNSQDYYPATEAYEFLKSHPNDADAKAKYDAAESRAANSANIAAIARRKANKTKYAADVAQIHYDYIKTLDYSHFEKGHQPIEFPVLPKPNFKGFVIKPNGYDERETEERGNLFDIIPGGSSQNNVSF